MTLHLPDPGPAERWANEQGFETGRTEGEITLYHVAAGPEDAPLVLLLHGFPECWYTWRQQLKTLAEEYRVVAPDLRGYNRSERPDGVAAYALPRLRADVCELLDALGDGTGTLVGHDWGGSLALSVARHHPDRVRRLVVANTLDPERLGAQIRGRQLLRSWYTGLFQIPRMPETLLSVGDYRLLRRLYADLPGHDERDIERYRGAWERPGTLTAAVNYYRALGRETLRTPASPKPISVPTHVLWGDGDSALRDEVADRLCAGIEDVALTRYDEGGHWVHATYPERFTRDLALRLS